MSITIVEYDQEWPNQFQQLKEMIATGLGYLAIAVEHVGSTSVPGLAAKPIIDMNVVVEPLNVSAAIRSLTTLGYEHQGDLGLAGREAFRSPNNGIGHHLYLVTANNREHQRQLLFRDYLRNHPITAQAYADLKRSSAQLYYADRRAYSDSKAAFIENILGLATRFE